jgi:hypothetical protein
VKPYVFKLTLHIPFYSFRLDDEGSGDEQGSEVGEEEQPTEEIGEQNENSDASSSSSDQEGEDGNKSDSSSSSKSSLSS